MLQLAVITAVTTVHVCKAVYTAVVPIMRYILRQASSSFEEHDYGAKIQVVVHNLQAQIHNGLVYSIRC